MSVAPFFNLDKNRYDLPPIRERFGLTAAYLLSKNEITVRNKIIDRHSIKHETNHKLQMDCIVQTIEDLIEKDNPALRRFIISRSNSYQVDNNNLSRLNAPLSASDSEDTQVIAKDIFCYSQVPMSWKEIMAMSLSTNRSFKNVNLSISALAGGVLVYVPMAGVSAHDMFSNSSLIDKILDIAILYVGISLLTNINYFKGIVHASSYLRKLEKATPDVRKYWFLGPLCDESLDEFTDTLEKVGAIN